MRLLLTYIGAVLLGFFAADAYCQIIQTDKIQRSGKLVSPTNAQHSEPEQFDPPAPYNSLIEWDSDASGWVTKDGARFFAIGIWNIPGHPQAAGNATVFKEAVPFFNVIHLRHGKDHPYMKSYLADSSKVTLLVGGQV